MLFVMVGRHKALRRPAENSELRASCVRKRNQRRWSLKMVSRVEEEKESRRSTFPRVLLSGMLFAHFKAGEPSKLREKSYQGQRESQ